MQIGWSQFLPGFAMGDISGFGGHQVQDEDPGEATARFQVAKLPLVG